MLPDDNSESIKFADWAWPMVLSCLRGSSFGVLTAAFIELLFRVRLIHPEARFIVDFLIGGAVVGVIGTASVFVGYLWIRIIEDR